MASSPRAAPIAIVTSLFVVCCLATQSQERCTENTRLRLTSPDENSQYEAHFLEVKVQDAWYRVCLHDVTTQTADVICSQLGFSHFRSLVSPPDGWKDDFWSDIAVQYSTLATCAGQEQCLSDCTGHQWQVVPFHGSTTSSIHPCYTQTSQLLLCETDDSTTINMELELERIQKPIQTNDTQTTPSDSLLEEVNKRLDPGEQDDHGATELPIQDSLTMSSLINRDELIVPSRNQSFSDQPFLQANPVSLFGSPGDKSSDLTRTEEQYDIRRDAGKSGSRDMDKAQIPLGGLDPRQPDYIDWVLDDYEDYYLQEDDPNSLSNKIENVLSENNGLSSSHQNPDTPEEQTTESEPLGSSVYRDTENVVTQINVVTQTPATVPDVILNHKETTPSYNSDTENVSNVYMETTEGEPDSYTTEYVQKASMSTGQSFFDQSSIINTKPAQDMIGGEVTTCARQQTPGENVAATTGIHLFYGEALMENIQTPSGSESFSSEKDTGYHQTNVTKTVDNNTDLKPWERKPESAEQRLDQMSTVSATSDEDVVHARTTPLPHTNDLTGVTIEDSDTEPMPIQTNNASDETDANTGKPTIATLFITQRGAIIGASERQTVQYDSANLKDATTSASELLETQSSKTATHTSHPHVEASESLEESVTSGSYSTSGYTEEIEVNKNMSLASESESAITQSLTTDQTKPFTGSNSGHKEPMTHTESPTDITTYSINEDQTNRPSPVDLFTEKQTTHSSLEAMGITTTSNTTASSSLVTQAESSSSGYYHTQYTTLGDLSNVTPAEELSVTATTDPTQTSTWSTVSLDTATEPSRTVLDMNHDATTIDVPLQNDSDQKNHTTTTIDSVTKIELDQSTIKFSRETHTPADATIMISSKPGENGFSSSSINGSSVQSGTTAAISQIDSTTIGQSDTHTAISQTDTTLTILRNTSNSLSEYDTTTLIPDISTTDDEFSDWNFDYEYYEFITGGGEKENIKDKGDSSNAADSDKGDSINDEDPDEGDSTNAGESDKGDSNDKGEGVGKGVTLVNVQDKQDDSLAAEKEEEEENTTTMGTWPELPEACLNLVTVTLTGPVNLSLPVGPGLSLPAGPGLSATRCRWRLVSQEDRILLSLSGHDPMTSVLTFYDVLTSENLTFPASESSEGSYKLVTNSTEILIEYRPVYSAVYTTVLLSVSTETLPRPTVHGKLDGGHSVSDVVKVVLIVCTVLLILTVVITGACCFIKQARPTRRIRDMPALVNLERGFSDKRDPHGKPPNQNNKNKIGSRRSNTDNTSMSYENFSTTDCQSGAVNETTFSHQHHHHHPQYQPSATPTDAFKESSASTQHSREIQPIRRSVSSDEPTNQQSAPSLTDQSGNTSASKRTTGLGSNFNSRVLPEIEEITTLRKVPFSQSEPLRRSTPIVPFLGMMSTEIKDVLQGDEDTPNKLYDANTRGSVTQLDLDAQNSLHDAHTTQGSITQQDRMHTSHQAVEDGSKLGRWNEWNIPVYSGVGPLETGLKWSLETEAIGDDVGSADSGLNLDCTSNYRTGSRASIDYYSDTGSNDSVCSLHMGNNYNSGKHVTETMSIDSGSFEIDSKADDSGLGKFKDSPVPHRIIKVRPYSATTTSINPHKNCDVKPRAASAGTNRNKKAKTMPEIFIKNKGGLYQSPKTTLHDLHKPCDNIVVDQKCSTQNVFTPPVYVCPLSKQVMRVPVVAPDGMTYDKKALLDWHNKHGTSPLSGKPFNDLTLQVDFILLAKIREWKLKVKRQKQQQGKIEIMADHPFGF